jgi:signal transduction histidine kinase
MEILKLIIPISAFFNFFLGFFVYLKDPRRKINRLFGIFALLTSFWILSNAMMGFQKSIFWLKIAYFFGPLIPMSALFWVIELCHKKIKRKLMFLIFISGFSLSFLSLFNNLVVQDVKKVYLGGFEGKAGPLFIPYWLYVFGVLIFILYNLVIKIHEAKGTEKLQIQYVLLGAILYMSAAIFVNFILPLFGIYYLIPLDSPSSLFLLFFTALAITKYHLFGIKIILTELLIGAMGIILFILPFLMPTFILKVFTFFIFLLFLIFSYPVLKYTYQEEQLREQAEKLAKEWQMLAQSKDQFIISIQHHFRTPLSIFKGYLSNILEGIWGPVPPEILNKLNNVLFSANDLTRLIESLLEVQQFKLGKGFLLISKEDISEVLKETIEELKPEIERRKLSLNLNIFPLIFEFDKKRIKEVFFNILNNAIKYSFPQGKITISLYQEKDSPLPIRISFQDEGKGMEKEEIETLKKGELFFRSKESSSFDATGKGIGLAISLEFIKAHGGQIDFYSQGKNKGTTVTVLLPLSPPKENAYYLSQAGILTRK